MSAVINKPFYVSITQKQWNGSLAFVVPSSLSVDPPKIDTGVWRSSLNVTVHLSLHLQQHEMRFLDISGISLFINMGGAEDYEML